MKYKLNYWRIGFLAVGLISVISFGSWMFREKVDVRQIDANKPEVSQEDIVVTKSEVIIKSFLNGVDSVKWLDEENILFEGDVAGFGQGVYTFNILKNVLEKYPKTEVEENGASVKIPEQYEVLEYLSHERILITEKGNDQYPVIVMNNEGGTRTLSNGCVFNGVPKIKYSANKDKIVFYDAEEETLKSYGVGTKALRRITEKFPEFVYENFEETIQISANGGYYSVVVDPIKYTGEGTLEEVYFSVFGADSGKIYGDRIMGINPSWSNDELKVAYFYGPDSELLDQNVGNGTVVKSKRVGVLDLQHNKIDYIDSPEFSKYTLSEVFWADDDQSLYYLAGKDDTDGLIVIDSILSYDLNKKQFINNETALNEKLIDGITYKLVLFDSYIGFLKETQEGTSFKLYDQYGNYISSDENLEKFVLEENAEEVFYYKSGHDLVTFDGHNLKIRSEHGEDYISIEEDKPFRLYASEFSNVVCIDYFDEKTVKIVKY